MASFEVNGILKVKNDTQVVSDKFSKREFVLTTDSTTAYPQYISFQLTQDKCSLLDNYQIGEEMKVSFNLRGREWNGPQGIRYFNSLEAWRLEKSSGAVAQPSQSFQSAPAAPQDFIQNSSAPIVDDLPF
jgi:hypothetical protein